MLDTYCLKKQPAAPQSIYLPRDTRMSDFIKYFANKLLKFFELSWTMTVAYSHIHQCAFYLLLVGITKSLRRLPTQTKCMLLCAQVFNKGDSSSLIVSRVTRFFLIQCIKMGKIKQMTTKCTQIALKSIKWPQKYQVVIQHVQSFNNNPFQIIPKLWGFDTKIYRFWQPWTRQCFCHERT
jgi:hypothetical protein